jgi:uncharacterized membrane protein YeaQ/YmgE (transglycosylase-associated protein family)
MSGAIRCAFLVTVPMIFLWAILIGLAAGYVCGFFNLRRDPGSVVTRMLIGASGGVVGGILAVNISPSMNAELRISTLVSSILLFIYVLIFEKKKKT